MIETPYLVASQARSSSSPSETPATKAISKIARMPRRIATSISRNSPSFRKCSMPNRSVAVLVVFQAMDAGGKDGAISHIFSGVNPQGCAVTSFKGPSTLECAHDFLWRIHEHIPARGMIGIFNRSHYERCARRPRAQSRAQGHLVKPVRANQQLRKCSPTKARRSSNSSFTSRRMSRKTRLQARSGRSRKALEIQRERPGRAQILGRLHDRLRGRDRKRPPPSTPRGTSCRPTANGSATGSSPTRSCGR